MFENPKISKMALALGFALSFALMLVSYFKVFFTEIGFQSVGRVWYYFRDYSDVGFTPTSFIGTVFSPFLSFPIDNPHQVAWYILGAVLLTVLIIFATANIKHIYKVSPAWAVVLAASPALLPHMGYNLGNLDAFLILYALLIVLFFDRISAVIALCIAGTLTHSLFMFAFFPLFTMLRFARDGFTARSILFVAALLTIAAGFFAFAGASAISPEAYAALMADKVPTMQRIGQFELFSTTQDYLDITWSERAEFGFPYFWFGLTVGYLLVLAAGLLERPLRLLPTLTVISCFSAMFMVVAITDIYRLVSMSVLAIFLLVFFRAKYGNEVDDPRGSGRGPFALGSTLADKHPLAFASATVPWIFLGPIGTTCYGDCGATAFPLLKMVLERLA